MAKQLIDYKAFNLVEIKNLFNKKNLLAFSAQADSTCLFFLLIANNIHFDIAIVNYNTRIQSIDEINYAKDLAKEFNKKIFICNATIAKSNFENNAREIRFNFFKEIIKSNNYDNLILANQLNDRMEWLLMQLCKGCGLNTLLGFDTISIYDNFSMVRPLGITSRLEIINFLKKNNIKYFVDETNKEDRFLRNFFRKNYTNSLIEYFSDGIIKSFQYLKIDFDALFNNKLVNVENIFFYKKTNQEVINIHYIDIASKKCGYITSYKQKQEILKSNYSCVIGGKIIIDCNDEHIFITNNTNSKKHDKAFRNILRIYKIPPKIRPFITKDSLNLIDCELKNYK